VRRLRVAVPVSLVGHLVRYVDVEDGAPADATEAERLDIAEAAGLAVADWAVKIETHAMAFEGMVRIADQEEVIGG